MRLRVRTVASSCEHGDEISDCIKAESALPSWVNTDLSSRSPPPVLSHVNNFCPFNRCCVRGDWSRQLPRFFSPKDLHSQHPPPPRSHILISGIECKSMDQTHSDGLICTDTNQNICLTSAAVCDGYQFTADRVRFAIYFASADIYYFVRLS
jgi:hypothetical protein